MSSRDNGSAATPSAPSVKEGVKLRRVVPMDVIHAVTTATCPRTSRLLLQAFPERSHDRVELISLLIALGLITYGEHAVNYRVMMQTARCWSGISSRDARQTAMAIVKAFGLIALVGEPLRLSKKTYRALLRREMAMRFGNAAVQKMLSDEVLARNLSTSTSEGGDAPGTAAVGAPAFGQSAFDVAANGVEACVGLLYNTQCLFLSSFWSAPFLIGCAVFGQVQQSTRAADGYDAKREAHRAETASTRLRELLAHAEQNGEAIALANGSFTETEEAMATLEAGQEFAYRREVLNARTTFACEVYNSAAVLVPIASVLPRLIRGVAVEIWDLQVAIMSFNGFRAALRGLVENMSTLRTAEAHAMHVSNLHDALDAVTSGDHERGFSSVHVNTPEDYMSLIEVESLTVQDYEGRDIIRGLDFVLCRGGSLAIVGSVGCGKTLLVKTLAGLWSNGRGGVRLISRTRSCVLSRKPYLPRGTLLDICVYPTCAADIGVETHELLAQVMLALGLGRHIEYLDVITAWDDKLSLSEQQRVAICRAVVNRAELCILDDATCAMDPTDRAVAYDILKKHVGGVLSLGDEVTLPKYHDRTIRLHADGTSSEFTDIASPMKGGSVEGVANTISQDSFSERTSTSVSASQAKESPAKSVNTFNPLQMDASRRENQFIRQQKKNVARVLGVKPEKLGVVPTPTKQQKRSPATGKNLSFYPLN